MLIKRNSSPKLSMRISQFAEKDKEFHNSQIFDPFEQNTKKIEKSFSKTELETAEERITRRIAEFDVNFISFLLNFYKIKKKMVLVN